MPTRLNFLDVLIPLEFAILAGVILTPIRMTNSAVIEQEYVPHVLLQPYVACYKFREVTIKGGSALQKHMPCDDPRGVPEMQ